MKIIFLCLFLLSLTLISYSQDDKYLPTVSAGIVVRHENYILSYIEKYECAEWVCYELTYSETENNVDRKSGNYLNDESIKTGSAIHNDYTKSGYDRGHLAPAGDMNFSLDAMWESFYMSNISPQTPELNRKTWKYLEDDIRYYVMRNKSKLCIITGNIFVGDIKYIGINNRVAVPTYLYKIIYDDVNDNIMAFIMPNINNPDLKYFNYITAVDDIEKLTGINFFPKMKQKQERNIESYKSNNNWLKK